MTAPVSTSPDVPTTTSPTPSSLLAPLRRELLPLAEAICFQVHRLTSEAADTRPPEFVTRVKRLDQYCHELLHLTEESIDPSRSPLQGDRPVRDYKHDRMGQLSRLLMTCETLENREQRDHFGGFLGCLRRIRELGKEYERSFLQILLTGQAPPEMPSVPHPAPPPSMPRRTTEPACEPGRILVVDDDAVIRENVVEALRGLGHQVSSVSNGAEARECLMQAVFDIILLDIRMPEIDGLTLLPWIRAQERHRPAGVIMISGIDDIPCTIECIEAGADDYLHKPFDLRLLHAKVASYLQKRRLRIRELEQFFPPAIARDLLDHPELLEQGAERQVSVLFCDIRGFSRLSRNLGPAQSMDWISATMDGLGRCVLDHGGVVVDFIGDELMALWGAPGPQPDHAVRACDAARAMFRCLGELNRTWAPILGEDMAIGVGVNSGPAWVGNTGTQWKKKYGALGNTVNVASRIQGSTKYLKSRLVISATTRQLVKDRFPTRRLARVEVVGIDAPIDLYEIGDDGLDWRVRRRTYHQALRMYESGEKLQEAARLLGRLIQVNGAEGPALFLMARTMEALIDREKWSPVYELPGK